MRCMNCWASGTSWMLTMAGRPRSAQISVRRRMIWRLVLGSRLAVGSSTSRSFGVLRQRPRDADPCRCPPDSASARLSAWSIRPTRSSKLIGPLDIGGGYLRRKLRQKRHVAQPPRQHVFHHRQAFNQRVFLEDHADPAALAAQVRLAQAAPDPHRPAAPCPSLGSTSRLMQRISVDLPAPEGPISPRIWPLGTDRSRPSGQRRLSRRSSKGLRGSALQEISYVSVTGDQRSPVTELSKTWLSCTRKRRHWPRRWCGSPPSHPGT
jgi:hypothetical protein